MAVLRKYNRAGSLQFSITSPVTQGGLEYIGGGKFVALTSSNTADLFDLNGKVATLDRTLFSTTGFAGTGQMVSGAYNGAGKLLMALRRDVGGPAVRTYYLSVYDIQSGTLDRENAMPASLAEGGVCFNGVQFFASHADTGLTNPERLYTVGLDGGVASINRSVAMANATPAGTTAIDLTYDGTFLWTIQGTNVIGYEVNGRQAPRQHATFPLTGVVTPLGIATDGIDLYVLSRN